MSQENVEVVRRQFAAFEGGDWTLWRSSGHPSIEWRAVEGAADDVGLMRGHEALRRYYQDWIDTLDHLHAEVVEVILASNRQVVVAVRNSGGAGQAAPPREGRYYVACSVEDERIVSGREFETREQALEAVGLSE